MNEQNKEINSSAKLKIFDDKTKVTYFVEENGEILTSIKNDKVLWSVNIIKECGKPSVGAPKIRHIGQKEDKIYVTFGKHSWAEVDTNNGKVEFKGSD